jgi:hypothetical protein
MIYGITQLEHKEGDSMNEEDWGVTSPLREEDWGV